MAKRRRKAKNRSQKNEAEASKKFTYTLLGIAAVFIIGFIVLRYAT